jgi:hypothetical protein
VSNAAADGSASDHLSSAILQQKMEENERQRRMSRDQISHPEVNQYLEDERIAIFLQNEEFLQELRRDKDFMSTLELDRLREVPDGPPTGGAPSDSDAAFKETIKKMGKVSRKKFSDIASLFSRRKRGSFQHLLGGHSHHNTNPSRDNLLLNNEETYGVLENEGSDNEEPRRTQLEWDGRPDNDVFTTNSARSPRHAHRESR